MAKIASEESIPTYLNSDFFTRTLEFGFRAVNVQVLSIDIENLTIGGENYCSNIYRAAVKYRRSDDEKDKELSLIIKSMPVQKQGVLSRLSIYSKETVFYLDIKPRIEALMWHTNETSSWTLAAKHFYSTVEPEQTIIFEDLTKLGFMLKSRQIGLDKTHSIMVMRKLAQYHALTMCIAEREPETVIEHYPFGLLNIESIKTEAFKALFGAQLLKLTAILNECVEYMDISKKLLKYYDNFTERTLKSVYPLKGELNVLNHGDLWVNNIFFKYDNVKNISEVRFIDFQLCYYGSPGFDINYFLNTSVQLEVLKNHRQSLIEVYFDSLLSTLESLPNIGKRLPKYDELLYEIQQREAFGFFVAFGFFPLMSMIGVDSQDNTLEKFHDEDFARQKIELMFKSNERTMETLKYAVQRLNDLGILD